ncbi:MAG: TolC family protein [Chloroflexi bacterium]|nr:TolC family protein [Chloroflexota bacterium]
MSSKATLGSPDNAEVASVMGRNLKPTGLRLSLLVAMLLCAVPTWAAEPWTLERALACALTNSPDARVAQHRIAAARAGLDQATAVFWPHVQFQSGYTRTDNPIGVFMAALNQRAFRPTLDFNNVPDADNLNVKGLALAAHLIDAETALTTARVRRAEAEGDRRIAVAALRKALGWPQLDCTATR